MEGKFFLKKYKTSLLILNNYMNNKQEIVFWAILYTITIFIISGVMGIFLHGVVPSDGPDFFKFVYAGLLNFWDTIPALCVGGYLVHVYHIKRKKKQ